jgi:hypothetical protein
MKVALAVASIFLARFAVGAWFDPGRDGDIAWQQWLGLRILQTGHIPLTLGPEAFTAPGAPWVPQEWALSVLVALTVGTPRFVLLVALTTLAGAATLVLSAWSARRLGASTICTAICVFCVAFSMVESYGIRAQVFAWAMLAAFMFVLRTSEGRGRWWMVPIVVVWANLHASALLAPALLALWTLGIAIQERGWNARVRDYAVLTLACVGAVFLTPLGYRLPLYAITLIQSPIRTAINEWQPSYLSATSFSVGALVLILVTCIFGVERSRRWPEWLLFAAVTWLALSAVRNVPVCAIVLGPIVAKRLTAYIPERLRINEIFSERPVAALLYCGALAGALLAGYTLAGTREFTEANLPVRAIATLASRSGTHNLYCEDFAWCSSALPYSNLREFIDGRCDPFPLSVWKDYETVYSAKGKWREVLSRRGVDAIVIDKKGALARALPSLRNWRLLYADRTYRLFVRAD